MKRIIIVDSQELVASSMAEIMSKENNWQVVDIFQDGEKAKVEIPGRFVDLVLMDLNLPKMNGLEACRQLHQEVPNLKIALWSDIWTHSLARAAYKNGAKGILQKQTSSLELIHALTQLLKGHSYYSPKITELLSQDRQGPKYPGLLE